MKKVLVEDIENHTVLARDVCGSSGNILLGKGTSMTVSMGRRLKNWGVLFVYVEGKEEHEARKNEPHVSAEEIRKQLEEKFVDVLQSRAMHAILDAVCDFRLNRDSLQE